MRGDIKDAIESARTVDVYRPMIHGVEPQRNRSPELIRAIVLAVVRELPEEMTVAELRDELEIAANQAATG